MLSMCPHFFAARWGEMLQRRKEVGAASDLMDPDGIPASEPGAKGPVITLFLPHQKPGPGVGRASLDILP